MSQLNEVLKHATLAVHDAECTSLVILMVCNGEPEMHMAVVSPDVHKMNSSVDLVKIEMLRMITGGAEKKEDRS
jgi:arabinogalactan endo-1,4-beta-galactosidase